MIRFIILVFALSLLIGCSAGYPKWKYRCYQADVKPSVKVPPMPNCRVNNGTLAGIDSDNDGVRDDVQHYIAGIDIDHPYFLRGLTQYARALQKTMLEHDKEELAQTNFVLQNLAADCAMSATLSPPNATSDVYKIRRELRELHLNTFERRSAHTLWRSYLETQLVPSVKPTDACNFEISRFSGERMQ